MSKVDVIVDKLAEVGYKRPQTIQDLIDNRDILFTVISNILDDELGKIEDET